jgi:hypothetical protein
MIDLAIPMVILDWSKLLIIAAVICIVIGIICLDIHITGGIYTMWTIISWIFYGLLYCIILLWGAVSSPDSTIQMINITWSK